MKLKKILSLCSVLAVAASTIAGMQLSASAATQAGTTYNYTGTENSASANDNSKISPYLDDKWTIPTSNIRGIMTGQSTRLAGYTDDDKKTGDNFGKCFTGAKNNYRFTNDLDANLVYYTFDFMSSGDAGSMNINGHRLNGADNKVEGVTYKGIPIISFADGEHKYYRPFKITIIVDKLNNKAYYCGVKSQTGDLLDKIIDLGQEANYIDIGNGYGTTNQRYFFKNFEYGTIDYEVAGDPTITAGGNATYSIAETGTSLGVNYTPANVSYTLASAVTGVSIANGTVTAAANAADGAEVTINANINGTTVASKTVTVSNPPASEPIATAEMIGTTEGTDGSVADVFYGTYTSNGVTTVNTINITVNGETKPLSIANLSGEGSVSFAVVISYADGDNKGYTPTFTVE